MLMYIIDPPPIFQINDEVLIYARTSEYYDVDLGSIQLYLVDSDIYTKLNFTVWKTWIDYPLTELFDINLKTTVNRNCSCKLLLSFRELDNIEERTWTTPIQIGNFMTTVQLTTYPATTTPSPIIHEYNVMLPVYIVLYVVGGIVVAILTFTFVKYICLKHRRCKHLTINKNLIDEENKFFYNL